MAVAKLMKKRLRAAMRRHPWVYRDSVAHLDPEAQDGGVVRVQDPRGDFVAWAFVNRPSRLYLRMFSFDESAADPATLFRERVKQAVALRHEVLGLNERSDAYRVLHSEADGIPGLIADRYGDWIVLSCTCLGTYQVIEEIADALMAELGVANVFEVGTAQGLRGIEGLPSGRGAIRGEFPPRDLQVTIDGIEQRVAISGGQKTGLFLDQRDNAAAFAKTCAGARVLDACCHRGFFAIAAAKAGAAEVTAFDVSGKALEGAEENAEINGVKEQITFKRADAFSELRLLREEGRKFDRIVLDPPKLAGRRKDVKNALRAYRELNGLALGLLAPGGLLLTCTCSHHISDIDFEATVADAARRQGLSLQILERRGPGADHPQEIYCPEGRYLKALLLRSIT